MSAISTDVNKIRNAVWADEVRESIAHGIEQCYSDVSNPTLQTDALEAALQAKIDEGEMAALTIGDGTITTAKIANGAITQAKLDSNISFEADDELDATSTNAIQNKVVTAAIGEVNESLSNKASANSVYTKTQIDAALANKVSTVNGVEPDATGNVTISAGGGIDANAITLLMTILNECLYGSNQSDNLVSLNAALRGNSIVSISAVVDGVPLAGTPFSEVPFIVTATYSDDSTATVSNYTVSSGTVVNGSNTATISYGGMSTTVTFTASDTRAYTITYNLTNVTSSNNTTLIAENSSYTATLSVSGNDYEMSTCTITMGGTDVTSTVLSGSDILIQSVTGNVVITATAEQIVYMDNLILARSDSNITMYSDDLTTYVTNITSGAGCYAVTEYPAKNACTITYTITNNSGAALAMEGKTGFGMISPDNRTNTDNGNKAIKISYWTRAANSSGTLADGESVTGTINLLAGYQLVMTAKNLTTMNGLSVTLMGGYVADEFSDYTQLTCTSSSSAYGSYRSISFYSDDGTTLLSTRNGIPKLITDDLAAGTYDVYYTLRGTYNNIASKVAIFGAVENNTATESHYATKAPYYVNPNTWYKDTIRVLSSGMALIDGAPAGVSDAYLDIRIKEAA